MKFTDGYWQMRPGMTPHYAAQLYDATIEDNVLTVYAPTRKLQGRGATISLPVLTVQFSSPMENVIRVQLVHHKGKIPHKPEFTIYQESNPVPSPMTNMLPH
jgi:alpha-D-xyloside xylohydrolase